MKLALPQNRKKWNAYNHLSKVPIALQWVLGSVVAFWMFFLASEVYAVIPFPRSTTGPPPDYYLDFPFLPEDSGLNKAIQTLNDYGVKPYVKYWGDLLGNPIGGTHQTTEWHQLLIFGARFDLERLMRWKGATFTLSATDATDNDLTRSVDSLFSPSQCVVLKGFNLYLVYLTQHLANDRIILHAGRVAPGAFFASLPAMGLTVNGAVNGNPASLFYNVEGFNATSRASWGGIIKVKPTQESYVQIGSFQVSPRVDNHLYHGVDFSFSQNDGVLLMAELGWSPTFLKETPLLLETNANQALTTHKEMVIPPTPVIPSFAGLPGLYQFGAYLQNYPTSTFLTNNSIQNIYGFYLQAQQMLWRSRFNRDHHFTIWNGITYSPQTEVAIVPVMAYGGLVWSGLIPTRDKDQLLLNYYVGRFSNAYSQSFIRRGLGSRTVETVFELSYIFQLTRQLQFQPDIQWFIQPGGFKNVPNALVIGFQISFVF